MKRKNNFWGDSAAKKHGIPAEGRDFLAEASVKINAGNFDVPEKICFFVLRLKDGFPL
tara:strand:- start:9 stop:182 length:174 start_codon:yes stop_codon:yes gene_type:complete